MGKVCMVRHAKDHKARALSRELQMVERGRLAELVAYRQERRIINDAKRERESEGRGKVGAHSTGSQSLPTAAKRGKDQFVSLQAPFTGGKTSSRRKSRCACKRK